VVVSFHSAYSSFGNSRLLPNSNLPPDFLLSYSLVRGVQLSTLKVTLVLRMVSRHPALSATGEHCCSLSVTEVPFVYSTLMACLERPRYLP